MNNPLLRLEILRNNLVELIANMELLFSTPVLLVDVNSIPEDSNIDKIVEEWKDFKPVLSFTPCEVTSRIDEKYQKMIDTAKEQLSFVNSEIQKYNRLPKTEGNDFYHVWSEGYYASGGHSDAIYLGSYYTDTFEDACLQAAIKNNMLNDYNERANSICGCKLFDNEEEARKSFG